MKDVYQFKSDIIPASFKDADQKKGIVTGYFSHFDSVDSDGDIIRPGAYEKTIKENGPNSANPRIKHLYNHNAHQPLGRLVDLKEDRVGLYYESQIGTHTLGLDFIKMVESGLITEHSVGFKTIRRKQLGSGKYEEGKAEWEINEIKLYEGSSLSAWGANMNTPLLGMKSEKKAEVASKRIELLIKALRDGSFSDDTFELLEIELKQLQQLYIDLTKEPTQAVVETPAPEPTVKVSDESLLAETIKQFTNKIKTS